MFVSPYLRLYGPLTVGEQVVACPQCGDAGEVNRGHNLKVGSTELRCGAKNHRFRHEAVTQEVVDAVARQGKGRFTFPCGDLGTVTGSTTIRGVFREDGERGGGLFRRRSPRGGGSSGGQRGGGGGGGGRRGGGGSGGPGLGGLLAAGLGTVNATLGTVNATVNAVGQGAKAVGEVAKVANNGIGVVRDGTGLLAAKNAAAYHQAADERSAAEAAAARTDRVAERKHEQKLQGVKAREAEAKRDHQSVLAQARAAQAAQQQRAATPQAARRRASGKAGGSAATTTRAAIRRRS
ncbi:hypothetical protein ACIPLC_36175 [Kitasatospora sp. NPDC086801]|uniref:hypothetical protein n=1 Tax=Kitasatospora sp. NPDC086801 TaxID=3364066 RepID=UPI00380DDD4A